jgi:hypothetical protein
METISELAPTAWLLPPLMDGPKKSAVSSEESRRAVDGNADFLIQPLSKPLGKCLECSDCRC